MKVLCLIFALNINSDGTIRQDLYGKDFGSDPDSAKMCELWKHQREFLPPLTGALSENYACLSFKGV